MIGQDKFNILERAIWETLEPYLEGPINLDLNDIRDSIEFARMVAAVTHSVSREIDVWGLNE